MKEKEKKAEEEMLTPAEECKDELPSEGKMPAEDMETEEEQVDEKDDNQQEIIKFRRLFGEIDPESIPDTVWDQVRKGQSLCATFALYLYEQAAEMVRVRQINEKNNKSAPKKITGGGGEEYFSPEAVRAMDGKTVRKQYEKIMRSMDHWN